MDNARLNRLPPRRGLVWGYAVGFFRNTAAAAALTSLLTAPICDAKPAQPIPPPPAEATAPPPATAPTPPPAPTRVRLPEGTEIRLSLDEGLSSATAAEGDEFSITTSDPISLDGGVVIPAGFHGRGEVTAVEKKGMLGKAGQLSVRLDYVRIGDTKVRLRSNQTREGKSNQTSVIVLSLLVTPLFLLMHGKDAKIPQGQTVIGFVDDDIDVTLPATPPVGN
jgi:hypothetical protein